jgi:hypothetical protein
MLTSKSFRIYTCRPFRKCSFHNTYKKLKSFRFHTYKNRGVPSRSSSKRDWPPEHCGSPIVAGLHRLRKKPAYCHPERREGSAFPEKAKKKQIPRRLRRLGMTRMGVFQHLVQTRVSAGTTNPLKISAVLADFQGAQSYPLRDHMLPTRH